MTNEEILAVAMRQSAIELNCDPHDFLSLKNMVVSSAKNEGARNYLKLPFDCDLASYGSNIVASVRPELAKEVKKYIDKHSIGHCFETPYIYDLNEKLSKYGLRIYFMAEYFLPDVTILKPLPCAYETKILYPKDFAKLYRKEWSNALNRGNKQADVIAMGAYDNGKLIALAGASADCESMWQIGIDTLPAYRKQGVASALTSGLAAEILKKGIVPFYCAAWANVKSVKNAIKSGFRPAWVEMTAKDIHFSP